MLGRKRRPGETDSVSAEIARPLQHRPPAPASEDAGKHRSRAIDALRAVAALGVVGFHDADHLLDAGRQPDDRPRSRWRHCRGAGLRVARAPPSRADPLAGLAAGFAAGSKYTALIPAAAVVITIALVLPSGRRARGALLCVAAVVPLLGAWLLRNAIATGNPLYPLGVSVGGHSLLTGGDGLIYTNGTSIATHLVHANGVRLRIWGDLMAELIGRPLLLVFAGLVAAVPGVVRRNRVLPVAARFAVVCTVAYFLTPLTGRMVGPHRGSGGACRRRR